MNRKLQLSLILGICLLMVGCSDSYIADFDCTPFEEKILVTRALLQGFREQLFPPLVSILLAIGVLKLFRRA